MADEEGGHPPKVAGYARTFWEQDDIDCGISDDRSVIELDQLRHIYRFYIASKLAGEGAGLE